jgi:deoxycytidylate deaminase
MDIPNIIDYKYYKENEIKDLLENFYHRAGLLLTQAKNDKIARRNYRQLKEDHNIACAIFYKKDGANIKYIAHSGFNKPNTKGYIDNISIDFTVAHLPELEERKQIFKTDWYGSRCVDMEYKWDRNVDAEAKILEKIAFDYNNATEGKLILYTTLYPCPSCRDVIKSFENDYPGIKVTVFYKHRNLKNPCDM